MRLRYTQNSIMSEHYFTSDTHYNHKNICLGVSQWSNTSGCRKFNRLEDMNDCIVQNINDTVKEDDVLHILGDFAFGGYNSIVEFRQKINCKNLYLIYGNHDKLIQRKPELQALFKKCYNVKHFKLSNQEMFLFHYALKVWDKSHHGCWHLYGHSHGSLPDDPHSLSMDVGFDVRNKPFAFDELRDIMSRKQWRQIDHHNEDTN